MRKFGFLILAVILTVTTVSVTWQIAKQRPQAPGTFPEISLSGGDVASLSQSSGSIKLCAWTRDESSNRDAGPHRPALRRLPSVETETTPIELEPVKQQPLLLTNPTPEHEVSLPAPPAVSERATGGPTLTPLEAAHQKEQSRKPFLGIRNFDRSMEVDADWQEKAAQEPPIDPQVLLSARLPNEVAARTRDMLKEATTLANRGAQFAARKQFEKIMRVTCLALDAQVGRSVHSLALARGLRAIEEADDFGLNGESAEFDLNLGGFIAGHETPVLKGTPPDDVTALLAMQAYYRYAIEQLAIAGNNEPISSQALFSLGRIEALLSVKSDDIAGGGPRALAFYHAALAVDPSNGRAANELGVMLARRGKLLEARNMFVGAVPTQPTAVLNLSKVYRQLGDHNQSQRYARHAQMIAARNPTAFQRGPEAGVRWVDQATFIRDGAGTDVSPAASPIRRASINANVAKPSNQAAAAAYAADAAKPKTKSKLRLPFGWKK